MGVVLIMSPWNYPFQLTLAPLLGALAAGNCAIVKPSAYSAATSGLIRRMAEELFPPELVKVVEGGRTENAALLEAGEVVPALRRTAVRILLFCHLCFLFILPNRYHRRTNRAYCPAVFPSTTAVTIAPSSTYSTSSTVELPYRAERQPSSDAGK